MSRLRRLQKFQDLKHDFMLSKVMAKLNKMELELCVKFITDNEELDKNEFCAKANRWYLDDPNKPKRLTDMWAIVCACA